MPRPSNLPTTAERQVIADAMAEERLDAANQQQIPAKVHRDGIYARYIKRLIDIVVSLIALVITLPVNVVIAIGTAIDVGWPILFHQERAGRDGELFTITKFRNMRNTVGEDGELLPASQRVTTFGRFVRRSSLDELLNFLNVLKGDMSLIGPRPLLPSYTSRYSERHRSRLSVRPGLECPPRQKLDHVWTWDDQFENDVWYVEHLSFITDCKMVLCLFRFAFDKKSSTARGGATRTSFIGYSEDGKAISISDLSQAEIDHFIEQGAQK